MSGVADNETKEMDANEAKNDELLYDPKSDEMDQKWVDTHRATTSGRVSGTGGGGGSGSDATLNCPACLTLLCLDCQRHDIYRTQYRAMFVHNCRIDFTQRLQYKDKQRVKKRKRNQTDRTVEEVTTKADDYYSVFCNVCNTQVAVYDSQEVYHFFGVLASF
ncbi:unnamed protein product [Oppiella nova]|uniref:E2F-associated phosphoprotein n=1 Tax=Oppiella nova TaxID=334625 RepID=A0A7R9LXM1_9ACAR|nr:unnamed protein product [Oppiella nova]CAG2167960.1 unnamed protein product [Oppiella nova]